MILLALLVAVQDVPAPPPEETDIVVIGKRLDQVEVRVGRDPRGKFTCALNQSSGRLRLDAALCQTAARCVRVKARDVHACVNGHKPELLADVRQSLEGRR
ncbi:hypothetical protein OF829_12220 [Sphingomonas sp. LB-2]|uniref:hypothetical protein n=1 Tax=Sphingomonas caeni TaxID=2984949 RepID=UPI00222E2BC8|nr:hypothetical protein [Sphingomonas caeni]MCW3848006.1 hypothetical protein [Sphingomonas caeni]